MLRLKDLRESRGINMKEAAKLLNMPYTTYVNYEKGLREPTSEVLIQMADFYGVTIDYLMGRSYSTNLVDISSTSDIIKKQADAAITPHQPKQRNIVKIAARNGAYEERILSDEQLSALKAILSQMPDASGDL